MCFEWQNRAERHIRRNIGFLPGTVMHSWHGPKTSRQYVSREVLIGQLGFDPVKHLEAGLAGFVAIASMTAP